MLLLQINFSTEKLALCNIRSSILFTLKKKNQSGTHTNAQNTVLVVSVKGMALTAKLQKVL